MYKRQVYVRTYKSIRTFGALAPLFCYCSCGAISACLRGTVNALREWYTIVPFSHVLNENSVNSISWSCIFTSLARYRRLGNNPYLILACTNIKQYRCRVYTAVYRTSYVPCSSRDCCWTRVVSTVVLTTKSQGCFTRNPIKEA